MRIPKGHPRKEITRVGQVGEDPRACLTRGERSYSCGKLNREVAGHADNRDDPRAEVGEDVRGRRRGMPAKSNKCFI